jgi:hypothetical protein
VDSVALFAACAVLVLIEAGRVAFYSVRRSEA